MFLYSVGQRIRLVNFVDRNNDWHLGSVGVVDSLKRLRHDTVVGRHHQHNDVGGFGAARTHAGERFVARRVEEYDLSAVGRGLLVLHRDFVGADVLGDATSFAAGHVGGANGIEQRGLAVIDVAHDGDHGRARNAFAGRAFLAGGGVGNFLGGLLFEGDHVRIRSEEACHFAGQFSVESLIDGGENAAHQQARDQILGAHSQVSPRGL